MTYTATFKVTYNLTQQVDALTLADAAEKASDLASTAYKADVKLVTDRTGVSNIAANLIRVEVIA